MTADPRPEDERPATDGPAADRPAPAGTDAADLVAQIRQLAAPDPAGVQQVVAEVLAALDRASGGVLRDQLRAQLPDQPAEGTPSGGGSGEAPPRPGDPA